MPTRISKPIAFVAVLAVLAGAGAGGFVLLSGGAGEDLERARTAAGRAAENRDVLIRGLERIAENLRVGASISGRSKRIHELAARQRESLEALVGLLHDQLRSLRRSAEQVRRTRATTEQVVRLSAEQLRLLRRAARTLAELQHLAHRAGLTSAEVAQLGRYGARLARDTRKAFEG